MTTAPARWSLAAATLVVVGGFVLLAMLGGGDDTAAPARDATALGDVVENPQRHAVATVTGDLAELLPGDGTPVALVLREGDDRLLVVPQRAGLVPDDAGEGDRLTVRGPVRVLGRDEPDAGPEIVGEGGILDRFRGRPAMYATAIEETG